MSDLISRQAAIDALCKACEGCGGLCAVFQCVDVRVIRNVPAIQPKRGKWIVAETAYEDVVAKCSVCGFETLVNEPGNGLHYVDDLHFCPSCGAQMEKGEDDA